MWHREKDDPPRQVGQKIFQRPARLASVSRSQGSAAPDGALLRTVVAHCLLRSTVWPAFDRANSRAGGAVWVSRFSNAGDHTEETLEGVPAGACSPAHRTLSVLSRGAWLGSHLRLLSQVNLL